MRTLRVKRRVRAAVNDHAAVRGPLREVAVAPDIREAVEIGAVIFLPVRVVPEFDRHRRKRLGADEFAALAGNRLAAVVPDFHRHAERGRLDFTPPDRRGRIRTDKACRKIGAAGYGSEVNVRFDRFIDVVETFRHQRRAGRGEHAHRGEIVRVLRAQPGLLSGVDELRGGAEEVDPFLRRIVENHFVLRVERRAVIKHQGRFGGQARNQPVPHHPAHGREPEHAVARLYPAVKLMLLQMLQQDSALAMHDAFRHAGRADENRM